MSKTKTYTIRINFFWDDGDDICDFKLTVPDNVTIEYIQDALLKEHNFLCFEDESDIYGEEGRNPHTLVDYVCKKYGWKMADFKFDIDLNVD